MKTTRNRHIATIEVLTGDFRDRPTNRKFEIGQEVRAESPKSGDELKFAPAVVKTCGQTHAQCEANRNRLPFPANLRTFGKARSGFSELDFIRMWLMRWKMFAQSPYKIIYHV